MKKILLLCIPALILGLASCKKENNEDDKKKDETKEVVQPNQKGVVFYFGGTWCPPCGSIGKPSMQDTKNMFGDDAIYISCQMSSQSTPDPMNNEFANSMYGVFSSAISGVPTMFVGCKDSLTTITSSSPYTLTATALQTRAQSAKNKKAAVYAKPKVKINGDQITVDIDATFFDAHNDEYRFAVYITESRLTHTQAADARTIDKNIHDDVLRLSLTPQIVGDVVATSVTAGEKISKSYTGTLNNSWNKANCKAVVVFWKKQGNGVLCVGGESTKL
jgi:thiol-disulfide isomerase/thioredoxin